MHDLHPAAIVVPAGRKTSGNRLGASASTSIITTSIIATAAIFWKIVASVLVDVQPVRSAAEFGVVARAEHVAVRSQGRDTTGSQGGAAEALGAVLDTGEAIAPVEAGGCAARDVVVVCTTRDGHADGEEAEAVEVVAVAAHGVPVTDARVDGWGCWRLLARPKEIEAATSTACLGGVAGASHVAVPLNKCRSAAILDVIVAVYDPNKGVKLSKKKTPQRRKGCEKNERDAVIK